jgi:hypothetical protein
MYFTKLFIHLSLSVSDQISGNQCLFPTRLDSWGLNRNYLVQEIQAAVGGAGYGENNELIKIQSL